MNSTQIAAIEQVNLFNPDGTPAVQVATGHLAKYLLIPSNLVGFHNVRTDKMVESSGASVYCHLGEFPFSSSDKVCDQCGAQMHINNHSNVELWHLPHGDVHSRLYFSVVQMRCPICGRTHMQDIPFKADGHRITKELEAYICKLLEDGTHTNKSIARMTGVNQAIVKDIDIARLKEKYTVDGKTLKKPERQARYLAIDEFKLHNGHRFATHIIDLETGHILWLAKGKKKQVVYDFIKFVGMSWMKGVIAIACDMNADFERAFREKCPHLRTVFDRFHIVKNFNEKVVNEIRKDEIKRLEAEGNFEALKKLKHSKYILYAKVETLKKNDMKAGSICRKGSELFGTDTQRRKGGYEMRALDLKLENELFFDVEIVRDMLDDAYRQRDENAMREVVERMSNYCKHTRNSHFLWFAKLLDSHIEGIISHASIPIASGKMEGINNKIKTLRRMCYGLPDDEYFFLKLLDMSRNGQRNILRASSVRY